MVEQSINNKPPVNKGGRPRLYKSALDMQNKIDAYFKWQEETTKTYVNPKTNIPTIVKTPTYYGRLLLYIGMDDYDTAKPYESGEYDNDDNKFSAVLARAKLNCEAELYEGAAQGIYNDRVAAAALERHHGFTKKQEININESITLNIGEIPSLAEIEARLAARRQAQLQAAEINVTPTEIE
jgi:hypothetical protein